MYRLDRYLTREVLGPLSLGFLVYTFLLLMQTLFRLAAMIIRRGVPAEQVGELLLLSLPNIVVLTIPMSFLFAILVASGRLAADSELIALRSAGISLYRLSRPIILLGALLTILNGFLMLYVLPRGNHALQKLQLEILSQSVSQQVQPRVFYEGWEGLVLYVNNFPAGEDQWQGVFVAESVPAAENEITVADRGEVILSEDGERLMLRLEDAVAHRVDFAEPDRYRRVNYRTLSRLLDDSFTSDQQATIASSKGLRELNLGELRERLTEPNLPTQLRNLTRVEIHKKFALPVACLAFALIGLPLGLSGGRGSGRSAGFAISLGIILLYWILLDNGEETARIGLMAPWYAMWRPNLLLAVLGLVMTFRANGNRSFVPRFLSYWWRQHVRTRLWRPRRRPRRRRPRPAAGGGAGTGGGAGDGTARFVFRLPRLRLQFPNIIDRYVMRTFLQVFALVTISGMVIYVVADFTEKAAEVLENEVASGLVADYYKYLLMQIYYEITPITVLLTTLVAFALLSRSNEVMAVKASGVSLYRLAVPAVIAAAVVVASTALLQATVLPASNQKVAQLKDEIRGRSGARTYRRADRQWLFGRGHFIYNYLRYDSERETLQRLQVFEFGADFELTRRLFATSARYEDGSWIATGTWVRNFGESGDDYQVFPEPVRLDFPEEPEYFESEMKVPTAMTYGELKAYSREVRNSGQVAPELEVELGKKLSYPAVSLIMALVALPFSFRLGRRGALYGVGVAIVVGMVFWALLALFTTLGETGALPPTVAVWTPNVLFGLLALYLFLGVRS
jgi:LPS export ABC transporter permease LptF/LPS export ABC transporter permease LptG